MTEPMNGSARQTKILRYCIGALFLLLPFSTAVGFSSYELELPTEPMLVVISIIGGYYLYQERAWRLSFFRHPLFLASLAYLGWLLLSTLFSNHFYVSAKYLIITVLHWWVYCCLSIFVFRHTKNAYKPWLFYGLSFSLILFYAWSQHSLYDFRVDASVLVARPFYFDHALYSTAALLMLGFTIPHFWEISKDPWSWMSKILSVILLIGVYLSFSRAAWLSLMGALVLTLVIVIFRLSFKQFIGLGLLLLLIIMSSLMIVIPQKTSQVLSKQGNSWQHLRSTINVSTDVSNLERLNRYSCAWRMFKTKPIFGYGPGNFIIDYYPFQKPEEMTRLSVTKHQKHRAGKGGGSHSEYLQALSEMGLIGLLLWIALILISIRTCIHLFKERDSIIDKSLIAGILFGLLSFFIHSLFNNFFHQEKIIALVWSALAVLIIMDSNTSTVIAEPET